MELKDIEIGARYKIDAVNTPGYWTVVSIAEDGDNTHVKIKKESNGKIRYVDPNAIVAPIVKTNDKKIVSESTRLIATYGTVEMWEENITSWPDEKRRGRKPKVEA